MHVILHIQLKHGGEKYPNTLQQGCQAYDLKAGFGPVVDHQTTRI